MIGGEVEEIAGLIEAVHQAVHPVAAIWAATLALTELAHWCSELFKFAKLKQ